MQGIFQTSCTGLCFALLVGSAPPLSSRAAEPIAATSPAIAEATSRIARAADKFLSTLDEVGRKGAVYAFNDEEQRKRWSNLPTSFVKRGGLRMGDLTPAQREAAMALLATALSPKGYEKVVQIVEADEVLNQGSQRKMFGRDEYYISFLGTPSATAPWMIQFGGHHLALNITLAGQNATLAPSHTAAQPAIYELEGKTIRPLGGETDKAHELMASLDESQRKQAVLGFEMRDLVLGPGRDGQIIQPEGLKGSELTVKQGELLLELAAEWTGIMHDAVAKAKLEEMKKHLAETWFAWSGPTEKGSSAYFRIQGPTVLIEYAPQRLGGDTKKHIHTIYRDPTNEYGVKWTKEP
ncbi:DUF3500 domain-containing protein [Verrucomicrobium sp. BvORR106]|uniref:DUF3500 domain-containing protein n=1 Tax=Verrucomicrobium sp. BvORR106 TaxID=1403819 RepID=UPI00068F5EBA|nr:DUF3500 domain-containing protein [Verrucomicrobium sp. BvORR106]